MKNTPLSARTFWVHCGLGKNNFEGDVSIPPWKLESVKDQEKTEK